MNSVTVTQIMRSSFLRIALAIALMGALLISLLVSLAPNKALAAGTGPCDIYASGGTPCVAAHSTVRALYGSYNGNLYQVQRASDNATLDIGVLSAGGFADAATQDNFCAGTSCVITVIYDQSGNGNDLTQAPGGGAAGGPDNLADASALPLTVGGNHVYGVTIAPGTGYRNDNTTGIATGDQPEGMYAILDANHYNSGCCFDYGNAETNNLDNGNGHMEAIYFGNCSFWGTGSGSGPWVMADLENGLFSGQSSGYNSGDQSITGMNYVTAIIKGEPNHWAIRAGNAQSGSLTTMYDGVRPAGGYNPMHKEGAIILGIGGDNSKASAGSFFEGAMTSGYPSNATEDSVQNNIVAVGYANPLPTPTPTTFATPIPQTDPVVWYKFDETSGTTAADSSGNGQDATVTGGTWVAGHINNAINLNGSGQYVTIPSGIVSNLNDFSIATWVKVTANSNWARIFDFGNDTNTYMFMAPQSGSNTFRYAITTSSNGGEQIIDGPTLSTGVWHHVAITLSGNTGTLYVDGTQVGQNTSMTLRPSSLGSTVHNWIGKSQWSADPYLDGQVDDFRIYNRGLSASEVQSLYSGSSGPTPTPTFTPSPSPTPTFTSSPSPTPTFTPAGPTNLALGQTATADSVKGNFTASNGNDGDTTTRWSASDSNAGHWWEVDLGSSYNLTGSEVMWQYSGRIYQYRVEVSNDNSNWTAVVDKTNNSSTAQTQTDNFSAIARYVRITVTGLQTSPKTSASFYEFRVFGS